MAQFPALPLWTDAYLGDTTHLTTLEHGAYLLLLMAMWRSKDTRLPNDHKILARYAKLTPAQFGRVWDVLGNFFRIENGFIEQGRLTDEANAVKRKSFRQSENVKARWLKNNEKHDTTVIPNDDVGNTPITTTTSTSSSLRSEEDGARDEKPLDLLGNEEPVHQSKPDRFGEFWSAYPKKSGKEPARKAWDKAIKRHDPEKIIAAARVYAEKVSGDDPKFTKWPQGWLNDERFLDDDLQPPKPKPFRSIEERRAQFRQGQGWGEVTR